MTVWFVVYYEFYSKQVSTLNIFSDIVIIVVIEIRYHQPGYVQL